jgi:parallel beta-helix repeat protein
MVLFLLLGVVHRGVALAESSTVRYVDGINGSDTGECTAFPCQTINYALSQASGGDTIQVASGIYTESLTVDKPVSLLGAGAETTMVKAVSGQRVVTITGETITNTTIISGFAFTGGNPVADKGGGVLVITSTPTIRNNRIVSNTAGTEGGGLYVLNSDGLILNNNTISSNYAATQKMGGGVYFDHSPNATVTTNTIMYNTGWRGGGLYLYHSPGVTLSKNTIVSNTAGFGWSIKQGGGLHLVSSDNVILSDNIISGNLAWNDGGGLFILNCANIKLDRNTISNNSGSVGGGLFLKKDKNATLINNIVADNRATGGLWIEYSSVRMLHTTIARNSGANSIGVVVTDEDSHYGTVAMTNTILVSHTVGITVTAGSTATLTATLWGTDTWANLTDWGGAGTIVTGTHNIWGEPNFVDPGTADYHLGHNSAAIDAGVKAGVNDDIDGDPRSGLPDLGADEYVWRVYLPLVLRNSGQ